MLRIPHPITTIEAAAKKGYIPHPSMQEFNRYRGTVRVYPTQATALNACERYGRPVAVMLKDNKIYLRWNKS